MKNKVKAIGGAVALALVAGGALAFSKLDLNAGANADTASQSSVVAIVNGEDIYESDIAPLLANNAHVVAVDAGINKFLTAQAARNNPAWQKDIAERMRAAEVDVLSAFYFERSAKDLVVSDADAKAYYKKHVTDEAFTKYEVSYTLAETQEAAIEYAQQLAAGDKDAIAKLKQFKTADDKNSAFFPDQFPYGIGRVVAAMKVGDVSQPLATRNGLFVLRLERKIASKKPEFNEVRGQIVQLLANQRLVEELAGLRKSAKIVLK